MPSFNGRDKNVYEISLEEIAESYAATPERILSEFSKAIEEAGADKEARIYVSGGPLDGMATRADMRLAIGDSRLKDAIEKAMEVWGYKELTPGQVEMLKGRSEEHT